MQQLCSYAVRIVTTSTAFPSGGGCAGTGYTGGWERARATSLCPPASVVGVTWACAPQALLSRRRVSRTMELQQRLRVSVPEVWRRSAAPSPLATTSRTSLCIAVQYAESGSIANGSSIWMPMFSTPMSKKEMSACAATERKQGHTHSAAMVRAPVRRAAPAGRERPSRTRPTAERAAASARSSGTLRGPAPLTPARRPAPPPWPGDVHAPLPAAVQPPC